MKNQRATKVIRKYDMHWPWGTPDIEIEFSMIRHGEKWLTDRERSLYFHYKQAISLLWPDHDWHKWNRQGLEAITQNDVTVFLGGGDSGKTWTMSQFVLTDWWSSPEKCLWLVSSTELRGAEVRIWGVLKQLFNQARERHPDLKGNVLESMHCITTDDISEDQSQARLLTRGILFLPTKRGSTNISIGALTGIKPQRGGRFGHAADEANAMPRVFLDAYSNWVKEAKSFRGIMSGNPSDLDDSLCIAAEPVDGWSSWVDTEKTQTWRSKFYNAFVIAFDGRDSPNLEVPPDQPAPYPYLIGRKKMEAVAKTHGKDSWQWSTQICGKPRPGIAARRVVTRAMCDQFNAFDRVTWLGEPTIKIGACDAAYGGLGGDRCVAGYIEFGKDVTGHQVIACQPPQIVPVSILKPGLPEDQIAHWMKDYMETNDVPPQNFFFDGRGSLAVAFARHWSPQVEAVEFGGKATERPVSADTYKWDGDVRQRRLQRCDELYSRFVTQLWFQVHYTIISDQMRQLPKEVAEELCRREWNYVSNSRMEVETKSEMKERTGESPDLGDWLVTAIEGACRRGFQIARMPGESDLEDESWKDDLRLRVREHRRSYQLTYAAS